jgi:C-5 cytosine-specific DNA methylase
MSKLGGVWLHIMGTADSAPLHIKRIGTKMFQRNLFDSWTSMDTQLRQRLECGGMNKNHPTWYEFFAGGGMARLGLGEEWSCTFSNEWCERKATSYRERFGDAELRVCDVADLTPDDLPGTPTLVWGSFPCQDLPHAGYGAGMGGERSGTFRLYC